MGVIGYGPAMAAAVPPRRNRRGFPRLRIVTAVPLCDGHDSAVMTINHELERHGAEVVYLGYHQSAAAIARAAVQEDAHAVGISSYNGGHLEFFRELVKELRARRGGDIRVFGGGGGTMTPADERAMRRFGVERIFFAGTPLEAMMHHLLEYAHPLEPEPKLKGDRKLAREITLAEARVGTASPAPHQLLGTRRPRRVSAKRDEGVASPEQARRGASTFVLGVAGPGGAGKSTLIDELVSRFLRQRPRGRLAVLANDPSHPDSGGALLGDRVSAIYAQDERVFFRSLATRGGSTGLSPAAPAAIDLLRRSGEFELIIVESVGIGQEADPYHTLNGGRPLADAVLYVTPPHYGGRIQLEKIALMRGADLVALNKCDDPKAGLAKSEITAALARNERRPLLFLTTAAEHADAGVDRLYASLSDLAELEAGGAGGERACQLRIHG